VNVGPPLARDPIPAMHGPVSPRTAGGSASPMHGSVSTPTWPISWSGFSLA